MKKLLSIIALLLLTSVVYSQRVKVTEGDFKALKGISQYDLKFDYDGVMIPKYDSEEDFLADKMAKREEKKPGDGERFKKDWFGDRDAHYEPKFVESFNKRFKKSEIEVGENLDDASYVMNVKTTMMWAGYNVGVVRKNAKLEATVSVYEKGNPSNVLWSANYSKIEGGSFGGYDFDAAQRIGEAYAKLAKEVAANIKKKAK
jgi:hypothetical protein